MHDPTPRIIKIGDALSQLGNVSLVPDHTDTDANESFSGRCHRKRWRIAEAIVDAIFYPFERNHCRNSYYRDLERARKTLERRTVDRLPRSRRL